MTINKAIKLCPFCGGVAHVMEDQRFAYEPYDFPKWYIQCKGCGVRTPVAKIEQLVLLWNKRTEIDLAKVTCCM